MALLVGLTICTHSVIDISCYSAADNPDDYTTVILAFSFTMEDSRTFTVTTIEDTVAEGAETLSVMFGPFSGPTNPGPNLDLTITDDDGKLPHSHIHYAYINMYVCDINTCKQVYTPVCR